MIIARKAFKECLNQHGVTGTIRQEASPFYAAKFLLEVKSKQPCVLWVSPDDTPQQVRKKMQEAFDAIMQTTVQGEGL